MAVVVTVCAAGRSHRSVGLRWGDPIRRQATVGMEMFGTRHLDCQINIKKLLYFPKILYFFFWSSSVREKKQFSAGATAGFCGMEVLLLFFLIGGPIHPSLSLCATKNVFIIGRYENNWLQCCTLTHALPPNW